MGTNYYARKTCRICEHVDELHIGKSSGGWCFSLHVYPEKGINDLKDWLHILKDLEIYDEYEMKIPYDEMIKTITKRKWHDSYFYESNHAEPGPHNLCRHKIDSNHCIKHGEGTWDCIIGEFC